MVLTSFAELSPSLIQMSCATGLATDRAMNLLSVLDNGISLSSTVSRASDSSEKCEQRGRPVCSKDKNHIFSGCLTRDSHLGVTAWVLSFSGRQTQMIQWA